jgi:hypothetical protein
MTIQVQVKNCEANGGRTVRVTEIERGKDSPVTLPRKERCDLQPGESRTFYIHLLKDLMVEELTPP